MELGVFAMSNHPPHRSLTDIVKEDLETIAHADAVGFDEYWLGEHFTAPWEPLPAPDLILAQAISRTKTIRLGTGVNCIPNHHPIILAHRIAQLDHMSEGRIMWGVGAGSAPGDGVLLQYKQDGTNGRIMQENVDAIVRLWTGDNDAGWAFNSSYDDRYDFKVPPREDGRGIAQHWRPYQDPHPEIAIAGLSKGSRTLYTAGERGWIPMSIHIVGVDGLLSHWKVYEKGAKDNGMEASRAKWRIARDIFVADSDDEAWDYARGSTMAASLEQFMYPNLQQLKMLGLYKDDPEMPDDDVTVAHVQKARWIVGSPETVARQLHQLYEAVGGYGGIMMLQYDGEGHHGPRWQRSMELLAQDVKPRLEDLIGR